MSDEPKRDWQKTWLHFFCGAVVGAVVGFYAWFDFSEEKSWPIGIFVTVGAALLMGFRAAFFLDDFWERFLEWFRWW